MAGTDYTESLDWLDTQEAAMKKLLLKWAGMNTYSNNISGINKFQDLVKKEFSGISDSGKELYFKKYRKIDGQGKSTLCDTGKSNAFFKRSRKKPGIFFCIHCDTVYPQHDPFQTAVEKKSGTINGPGVADAKGGLVILLFLLRAFERSPFQNKPGWEVFINSDEEIGAVSSRDYLEKAAKRHRFGLLFEPAMPGGVMVSERKGSGVFRAFFYGKAAHAGRDFHKGKSAVYELARFIRDLEEYTLKHHGIIINAGNISVDRPVNVVPDFASLEFNVRVGNQAQMKGVLEFLESLRKVYNSKTDLFMKLTGEFHAPPKELNPETKFLMDIINEAGAELKIPLQWHSSGGASDGNKLAYWGLPNIDSMGPVGYNIHSDGEYIETDSLLSRAKLGLLTLFKLCEKLK